jgi:hypothetical protein
MNEDGFREPGFGFRVNDPKPGTRNPKPDYRETS